MNSRNKSLLTFCIFVFLLSTFSFLLFSPLTNNHLPTTTWASTLNTSPIGPSTLYSGLVGWWTFDGNNMTSNVKDSSGQGNNGSLVLTPAGNTATSTGVVPGRLGQAFKFDGVDDYVNVANSTSLNITTNTVTVSVWVNGFSPGNNKAIVFKANGSGVQGYLLQTGSSGNAKFGIGNGSFNQTADVGNIVWNNKWHLLTGTYDGNNVKIYVNGVLNNQAAVTGNISDSSGFGLGIAARNPVNASFMFPGLIDDVRVYSRTLSATEISELYNEGSGSHVNTSPIGPAGLNSGLVAWWTFDGGKLKTGSSNVLDSSGNSHHGTVIGTVNGVSGKLGQAATFTGVSGASSIEMTAITTGTTFTYSSWIYPKTTMAGYGNMFAQNSTAGIWFKSSKVDFFYTTDHTNNTTITLNRWHHVVVDSNAGAVTYYLDGVADGTSAAAASFNGNAIGADNTTRGESFVGNMDDVRLYSRALSATEVSELYKEGLGSHVNTSPIGPAGLNSGLVAWWTFDGPNMVSNVKDSSGQGNDGNLTNFAATSTVVAAGKLGQALRFNRGTTNRIVLTGPTIGTTNTVSMWIYPKPSSTNFAMLFGTFTSPVGLFYRGTLKQIQTLYGGGSPTNNTAIADNLWHHIVAVDNSGTITFYIDGKSDGGGADSGSFTATTIGIDNAGEKFNGLLDDIRIYSRALSATEVSQLYNLGR